MSKKKILKKIDFTNKTLKSFICCTKNCDFESREIEFCISFESFAKKEVTYIIHFLQKPIYTFISQN